MSIFDISLYCFTFGFIYLVDMSIVDMITFCFVIGFIHGVIKYIIKRVD